MLKIEYTIVIQDKHRTIDRKQVYDETAVFEYLINITRNNALLDGEKIIIYKEVLGAQTSMHSNKRILIED